MKQSKNIEGKNIFFTSKVRGTVGVGIRFGEANDSLTTTVEICRQNVDKEYHGLRKFFRSS